MVAFSPLARGNAAKPSKTPAHEDQENTQSFSGALPLKEGSDSKCFCEVMFYGRYWLHMDSSERPCFKIPKFRWRWVSFYWASRRMSAMTARWVALVGVSFSFGMQRFKVHRNDWHDKLGLVFMNWFQVLYHRLFRADVKFTQIHDFETWFLCPKQHGPTRQRVYACKMQVLGI